MATITGMILTAIFLSWLYAGFGFKAWLIGVGVGFAGLIIGIGDD